MQSSSVEIALVLRRLADSLENGNATSVQVADEQIFVPAKAEVKCTYESRTATKEINIRVTWGLSPSTPHLIRQHSEQISDAAGNRYEVFIYGELRPEGTWEGWLEFVPLGPGLSSLRTGRETTQPDLKALEYWSTGLEPVYLTGAFERASSV